MENKTNAQTEQPKANAGPKVSDIIFLPGGLINRIKAASDTAQERIAQIEKERDSFVRTLLEGFLAGIPESEGKVYDLSAEKDQLIQRQ